MGTSLCGRWPVATFLAVAEVRGARARGQRGQGSNRAGTNTSASPCGMTCSRKRACHLALLPQRLPACEYGLCCLQALGWTLELLCYAPSDLYVQSGNVNGFAAFAAWEHL